MSEHTKGRLAVKSGWTDWAVWIIPADQISRPIGGSTDSEKDRNHYANVVASVDGKYHDRAANARRLIAAWNFCEDMKTETMEQAKKTAFAYMTDADQHAHNLAQELNAARALLREALDTIEEFPDEDHEIADRIKIYLDACDKPK